MADSSPSAFCAELLQAHLGIYISTSLHNIFTSLSYTLWRLAQVLMEDNEQAASLSGGRTGFAARFRSHFMEARFLSVPSIRTISYDETARNDAMNALHKSKWDIFLVFPTNYPPVV